VSRSRTCNPEALMPQSNSPIGLLVGALARRDVDIKVPVDLHATFRTRVLDAVARRHTMEGQIKDEPTPTLEADPTKRRRFLRKGLSALSVLTSELASVSAVLLLFISIAIMVITTNSTTREISFDPDDRHPIFHFRTASNGVSEGIVTFKGQNMYGLNFSMTDSRPEEVSFKIPGTWINAVSLKVGVTDRSPRDGECRWVFSGEKGELANITTRAGEGAVQADVTLARLKPESEREGDPFEYRAQKSFSIAVFATPGTTCGATDLVWFLAGVKLYAIDRAEPHEIGII